MLRMLWIRDWRWGGRGRHSLGRGGGGCPVLPRYIAKGDISRLNVYIAKGDIDNFGENPRVT